jgi:dTDP-4-dehydrorhamnose reductase
MNSKEKKISILILGSGGQLGSAMAHQFSLHSKFNVICYDHNALDITNYDAVEKVFEVHKCNWVINCAAYTNVDKAEQEFEKATEINTISVGHLSFICSDLQIPLIHFSSDYVYHNKLRRPLLETDPTYPQSIYAQSKLYGEEIISEVLNHYLIFRTSWLYSDQGHNFVNTMLLLAQEKDVLTIVNDQIGAPTLVDDIADAVCKIVLMIEDGKIDRDEVWGIYNMSNQGKTNWFEYAQTIFSMTNKEMKCIPISTEEFNAPAPRPSYSLLSNQKLKTTFQIELRNWQTALKFCLQKIQK